MFKRTRRQNLFLILTLGILNALTPFSIDMYLPAFPEIAKDLNVGVAQVALSVSVYFIGFAFGQIIYGPLFDRFGRKPPLLVGLAIYTAGTLGCLFADSIQTLLIFRMISAIGGCAATVGAMTMVRDFFPPEASSRIFSMLMLVLSLSPLLAPSVGSLVVTFSTWRTVFGVLAVFGIIDVLLVIFSLPQGALPDRSVQLRLKPILLNFKSILMTPRFCIYTLAGSFSFAGLFVYVAGSPSIFMDGFQVSAQFYGGIFAFLALGMIGGGQVNLLLIKKHGEATVFKTALTAEVLLGIGFLLCSALNVLNLWTTIAFLFCILICTGITYPNAAALALAPFTKNIGSASSLLGFLQLGIGALSSAGVGLLEVKGSLPTAATICVSSIIGFLILFLFSRRLKDPPETTKRDAHFVSNH